MQARQHAFLLVAVIQLLCLDREAPVMNRYILSWLTTSIDKQDLSMLVSLDKLLSGDSVVVVIFCLEIRL